MKKIFFISFFVVYQIGFAQKQAMLDSLLKVNQNYLKEDTVKINLLGNLAELYATVNVNEASKFIDQAIVIATKIDNKVLLAKVYGTKAKRLKDRSMFKQAIEANEIALKYANLINSTRQKIVCYNLFGNIYLNQREFQKAKEYFEQALALAQQVKDKYIEAICTGNLALIYSNQYDYLLAVQFNEKAIALYQQINDQNGIALINLQLSNLYIRLTDYPKSINYAFKALEIYEKQNNIAQIAQIYTSLGTLYDNLGDKKQALAYAQKALIANEKVGKIDNQILSLQNVGAAYLSSQEFDKALIYYNRAIELATKSGLRSRLGNGLYLLSWLNYKQNDFDSSKKNIEKAIEIFIDIKDKRSLAKAYGRLANIYWYAPDSTLLNMGINPQKRVDKVIELNQNSLEIAQNIKDNTQIIQMLSALSIDYETQKDYQKAYNYHKKYISLRDSIKGDDVKEQVTRKEIQFEYEKKEAELKYQQQLTTKELENQKLLTNEQRQELLLNNQTIQLQEQNLVIINKEKDLQRLAYLSEKAEKQKKEQELRLAEKDKKLKDLELINLLKEKALQLQTLTKKNAVIGFLIASLLGLILGVISYVLWQKQRILNQGKINSMNFTKQLLENTEDERKRIASDLHDSISHELLNLKSIFTQDLTTVNAKIDTIINDIRGISRNLHPVMFDKIGLVPNIEQLVERIQNQNNFFISTDIVYTGILKSADELQIYRIIQEALTNIIKYAKAHAAKITILEEKDNLTIEIRDNGKGFDVKQALNSGKAFGLHNIIERSRVIGGEADIISSSEGTIIYINIPKKS